MKCEYGCGRESNYKMKSGKWCCEDNYRKCPAFIEKVRNSNKGKKRDEAARQNLSKGRKGKKNKKPQRLKNSDKKCYYCGNQANYYFTISERYCCEDHPSKCPKNRKIHSERLLGHSLSIETKRKISKKIIELNETNDEYKRKQSESRKISGKEFLKKHQFFVMIERPEIDRKTGEILVRCKLCKNKFVPTQNQLYERVRQLESEFGQGGCYFYCSDDCKNSCPLFNLNPVSIINIDKEPPYTESEYQTFRSYVLKRDNYICQFCGDQATEVHHERPQKLEPFFALDPDYAWSCCKKCHYKKGHQDECSTGNLANVMCI